MSELFDHAGQSLAGRNRYRNEDETAFGVHPTYQICSVADVRTIHSHGGSPVAMMLISVMQTFFSYVTDGEIDQSRALRQGVACAHGCTGQINKAFGFPFAWGMLAALSIAPRHVHFTHVGNCRIYRVRERNIAQMTEDHTVLWSAHRGEMKVSPSELESDFVKSLLARSLGQDRELPVDVRTEEHSPGDVYVLCTQGLHEACDDASILSIVLRSQDLNCAASELVSTAYEREGKQNITCLLVRIR